LLAISREREGKFNGRALPDGDAKRASLSLYNLSLVLSLIASKELPSRPVPAARTKNGDTRLILSILESWGSAKAIRTWQDEDQSNLEKKIPRSKFQKRNV
jgi:hypothetical protein